MVTYCATKIIPTCSPAVADPDFELRREPGSILLAQPTFRPSVISSFFTQNKEGARAPRASTLDPSLTSDWAVL